MNAGSLLPHHAREARSRLALRSSSPMGSTRNLVLMVPGGPGVSGRYLDPFLAGLELDLSWNLAILDLPGHGLSKEAGAVGRMRYPELVRTISDAIQSLAVEHERIVLLGQSLGGRLLLDVMGETEIGVAGAVMIGAPFRFEPSTEFQTRMVDLGIDFSRAATEAECVRLWRSMIPMYFKREPREEEVKALCEDTSFLATSEMLDGAETSPSTRGTRMPLSLFLQGTADIVVPDRNVELLREIYGTSEFKPIPGVGHFPMLEAPNLVREAITEFVGQVGRRSS